MLCSMYSLITMPLGSVAASDPQDSLPSIPIGCSYYVNSATGATQWEVPTAPAVGSGAGEPASVRASHILVKHTGSRRPSSWRCPVVTLTKDEALSKLSKIRASIVSGAARFEEVARTESDCSSAAKGGDLGAFGRGAMQKPFEDATYALKVVRGSGQRRIASVVHAPSS